MTETRTVTVDGKLYSVTLSDEQEALLAADAAGRAVVGLWNPEKSQALSPALYAVEDISCADQEFLERVVRRREGLPWILCETPRLIIREFQAGDAGKIPWEEEDAENGAVFRREETLQAYIEHQYGFREYGIWAVVKKSSGILVGKAGIAQMEPGAAAAQGPGADSDDPRLELGYHIFRPYRRRGYGEEACRAILAYAAERLCPRIYARVDVSNEASIRMAEKLGFRFKAQRYSGVMRDKRLYEWCCSQ